MRITAAPIAGAFIVDMERREDARGYFARTYCPREFAAAGVDFTVAQANVAFSHHAGTLRGMHYQLPPSAETKLIRCARGAIYDVLVDMRPDSPTYLRHFGLELTAASGRAIYVPSMIAHGYQTLADATEVTYLMGDFYDPTLETGLRHDDPSLGIAWPRPVSHLSEKDAAWPLRSPAHAPRGFVTGGAR